MKNTINRPPGESFDPPTASVPENVGAAVSETAGADLESIKSEQAENARHLHSGSWISEAVGNIYEKFFAIPSNRELYERWQADEDARRAVANMFHSLSEALKADKTAIAGLRSKVENVGGADVALTVYKAWKAGSQPLETICGTPMLAVCSFLAAHGPALIKRAESELAVKEKELAAFVAENKATLRELNLI